MRAKILYDDNGAYINYKDKKVYINASKNNYGDFIIIDKKFEPINTYIFIEEIKNNLTIVYEDMIYINLNKEELNTMLTNELSKRNKIFIELYKNNKIFGCYTLTSEILPLFYNRVLIENYPTIYEYND